MSAKSTLAEVLAASTSASELRKFVELGELEEVFRNLARACREVRSGLPLAELEGASEEIPLQEIRKQLRKVIRASDELEKLQNSIALPPLPELDAMIAGKVPVSNEAFIAALLQFSLLKLEAGASYILRDLHSRNINDPAFRRSWAYRDSDVSRLLKAVRSQRGWKEKTATSGTPVASE